MARVVTEHVRQIGKHFLSERILTELSDIRSRHAMHCSFLDAFLDCLLDKHEGRYWNRTYLALPLLELLLDDQHSEVSPDRLSTLLVSDAIRFETETAGGSSEPPCRGRPDPATLRKRLRHALRFVADDLGGPDAADPQDLVDRLPRPPATDAGRWFDVTVQPVYVLHDEYFFIRVLQTHEMLFTEIARDIRKAVGALRDGKLTASVELVDHATAIFERAAALFRITATMRAEQFSVFRQFTQGASAIQSEQYKKFEILCGVPPAPRLHSAAFTNVPAVRDEAESAAHDTVTQAYLDLRRAGAFGQAEWNLLDSALGRLEARHQRWKSTHRSLAVRMLGDAHGSGHTDGVPYLTKCVENRLFWQLSEE
ncbi:tryptophan 2,3-dioxygenase family protein [Streptomyces sp. NPDC008086]|uniref:tryptophan 2,3-dioxygenase family protein n=1 Tax=Streptomyces sp. NPDC008086 TaxID=3364807 RepID=UPI0036F0477E